MSAFMFGACVASAAAFLRHGAAPQGSAMKEIEHAVSEARAEVERLFAEARIDIDRAIAAARRRALRETMWAFWGAVLVAFLSGVVMGWTLQTWRLK